MPATQSGPAPERRGAGLPAGGRAPSHDTRTAPAPSRLLSTRSTPQRPNIIPVLQRIQEQHGYLPRQEIARAAEACNMSLAQAYGVATFYNFFRLSPPGRHTIRVCRGTACHVRGSAGLLEYVEKALGIRAGETTPDGAFSIETVACLGCCSRAPVMVADEEIHGRMSRSDVQRMLRRLERGDKGE